MTIEEFNKTTFGNGDKVIYNGKTRDILSVDFCEALFGIEDDESPDHGIDWVRCENCIFITSESKEPKQ